MVGSIFRKINNVFRKIVGLPYLTKKGAIRVEAQVAIKKGKVLVSYLSAPLLASKNDPRFKGHSNFWEAQEIVRIFSNLGYTVDCINWDQRYQIDDENYSVIFDIANNLQKFIPFVDKKTKKILHITGSYWGYSSPAEVARVKALEDRTGMFYSPKRLVIYPELAERSLAMADVCSLIGNTCTLETFPKEYRSKITLVPVSASLIGNFLVETTFPKEREFLFFAGFGAVHKGLDLVLEAFKRMPYLTLNIVGSLSNEYDFLKIYHKELFQSPHIKYHGFLYPSSSELQNIVKQCVAFINPSCSESISTAVATCMQLGLFPIVSRNTGVDLPKKCGFFLETCSIEEIMQLVLTVYNLPQIELEKQMNTCKIFAQQEYSRSAFTKKMYEFITKTAGC